jgi:outer membrane usher protein
MWSRLAAPRKLAIAVFAALLLGTLIAPARAADQKTFLPLVVNGQDEGTVLVIARGDDFLVRASDLADAGLHVEGHRETIDGVEWVSLQSLAPGLKFHIDTVKTVLVIDAAPSLFGSNNLDLSVAQPKDLRYGAQRGGYLNYAVSDTNGQFNTFQEASLTNGKAIFTASASEGYGGFERDLTSLEWDNRARLQRTTLGDAQINGSFFSSSAYVGGLTVQRDTSLNPYAVTHPTAGFDGTTSRPATALVYSNGVLIRTIDLRPGAFDLNNLPLAGGAANVQIVIRDALGETTTIGRNLYVSNALLVKGFTDYSYSLGFLRDSATGTSSGYGPGAALGAYRLGVTDNLTAGAAFESGGGITSGGPNLTVGVPIGEFSVGAAASTEHGVGGTAALASYTYNGRRIGVTAGVLTQSANFAKLSLDASADRILHDESLAINGRILRGFNLGVAVSHSLYRDSGINNSSSVNLSTGLGGATLIVTATRSFVASSFPQRTNSITANVYFTHPGHNTTEQLSVQSGSEGTTTTAAVQKLANAGVGFGYTASVSRGAQPGSDIGLIDRTPFAIATFDRVASNQSTFTSGTVSGSIATLGTGFLYGRPIDGAYAIVQTPNVAGLPVFLGGELQGNTDRQGRLLIPSLVPNFENSVNIDVRSLPQDVDVSKSKELIAPFARTGMLVVYDTHHVLAITGTVVIRRNGVTTVPELSGMTIGLPSGPVTQGLGGSGTFYFENVPSGQFKAHVEDDKGGCDFTLTVPAARSQAVVNLGTLTCEAR